MTYSSEEISQLLNTAAEQRFLGTYTTKILIVDRKFPENSSTLAKAHRIHIMELPFFPKAVEVICRK